MDINEKAKVYDAAYDYARSHSTVGFDYVQVYDAFVAEAEWMKKRAEWKPSKEQMDALNSAIANATPQTYATLSKLYNDLKILMEE